MKKIAFITHNYPPTICGVGDHTARLAGEMSQIGLETHVICAAGQKPVAANGVQVYPIVEAWNRAGVAAVVQKVLDLKVDWVIVQYVPHGFHPKGLPFVLLGLYKSLKKRGVSVLTVFHEIMIRRENNLKKTIFSILQVHLAHRLAALSEKIVTSIDLYADVLNDFSSKMSLIPVGSNILPQNTPPQYLAYLREKYGINDTTKVICTFGNRDITPYLPVFDQLSTHNTPLIWLLCGKNTTPIEVLKSRTYLRYAGELTAEDIFAHLRLGNVFFMPDPVNAKGQGGTSNKSGSLACGCALGIPIVGSKGDMNNQLLESGKNIILTDIRDNALLSQSLRACLEAGIFSKSLGRNARLFYDKKLSWQAVSQQFLDLMDLPIETRLFAENTEGG